VVSGQLFTAAVRVRAQVSIVGLVVGKVALGQVLIRVLRLFLCFIFTHVSSGGRNDAESGSRSKDMYEGKSVNKSQTDIG
jgi:hypothetical protein